MQSLQNELDEYSKKHEEANESNTRQLALEELREKINTEWSAKLEQETKAKTDIFHRLSEEHKKVQLLQDKINTLESENNRLSHDLEAKHDADRWYNLSQQEDNNVTTKNVRHDISTKFNKAITKEQRSRNDFSQKLVSISQEQDRTRKALDEKIEQHKQLIEEYSRALAEERKLNRDGHDFLNNELKTKLQYIDYLLKKIDGVETKNEELKMKLENLTTSTYSINSQDNVNSTSSSQDLGETPQEEDVQGAAQSPSQQQQQAQGNNGKPSFYKQKQYYSNNNYHHYQQSPRSNTSSPRYQQFNNNNTSNTNNSSTGNPANDVNGGNRKRTNNNNKNYRGKKQLQNNQPPHIQSPPINNNNTTTTTTDSTQQNGNLK